jgi:Arc/MetJ-type ribon-helix-helix transcriptional regulator
MVDFKRLKTNSKGQGRGLAGATPPPITEMAGNGNLEQPEVAPAAAPIKRLPQPQAVPVAARPAEIRRPSPAHDTVERISLTLPKTDRHIIENVIDKCMREGIRVSQSEVLRLGLHELKRQPLDAIRTRLSQLDRFQPGRPTGTSDKSST